MLNYKGAHKDKFINTIFGLINFDKFEITHFIKGINRFIYKQTLGLAFQSFYLLKNIFIRLISNNQISQELFQDRMANENKNEQLWFLVKIKTFLAKI